MAAAQEQGLRAPGECIVRVDDREVSEFYPALFEVQVRMSRGDATLCSLVLDTMREGSGRWSVQDSEVFVPWRRIVVEAAFGERVEEVMRGYIREVRLDYPREMGQARAVVIGQDESLLLDREHVRRVWSTLEEPVSDGEIVQRVADEYGLQASVEPGLTAHGVSQSATPARFLMDRAEANGFELFVRQGRIHFQPPDLQGDPQPPVRIYAGDRTNCLRFAATFDGHRPDRVAFTRAASAGTGNEEHEYEPDLPLLGSQPVDSERMGLVPFTWWLDRVQGASLAEAQARAQARANEHGWKISAEGELDGVLYGHVLLTHRTVAVDGAGGVYDGTYYVDRVTHVFNADGYRQEFRFLRNGLGD